MAAPRLHFDFETRSVAPFGRAKNALTAYQYARHPTTDVWCMSWCVDDDPVLLWDPWEGQDFPSEFLYAIKHGATAVAHNAGFEWCIWNYLLVPRLGLPRLSITQMDCTAVRAAVMALPRSLEGAGAAMGLAMQKDKEGSGLMQRMAKPRKPRKGEDPDGIYWWDDNDRRTRLGAYCVRDTEAERELDKVLRPLTEEERLLWLHDHKTNMRGVQVDVDFAKKAKRVMAVVEQRYIDRLTELTDGEVTAVTQVAKMKPWLAARGVETDGLDKTTVINLLDDPSVPADARELLEIRQEAGKSSVAKLDRFITLTSADGRMRENFLHHGANTGRAAGKGAQLQNLPSRGGLKWQQAEQVIDLIMGSDDPEYAVEMIELLFGPVPTAISSCLRACIKARKDRKLFVADFSNIEGRVAAWLGGELWKIAAFLAYDAGTGPDLYKVTAGQILGTTPDQVDGSQRNVMGKVPELALGFGGGVGAFQSMAKIYNVDMAAYWPIIQNALDDKFIEKAHAHWDSFGKSSGISQDEWLASEAVKVAWRSRHPGIVRCWYDAEECAILALKNPGQWYEFADGKCAFGATKIGGVPFLISRLPNGRKLYRADAKLRPVKKFGRMAEQVTFMGVDSITRQYVRMTTYGGDLFQSCLAAGTLVLTSSGWVAIEDVTPDHVLWDGEDWVSSHGVVNNGLRQTIELSGVHMTPDHLVLTHDGWQEASSSAGINRAGSRLPNGNGVRWLGWEEIPVVGAVRLRNTAEIPGERAGEGSPEGRRDVVRMPEVRDNRPPSNDTRDVTPSGLRCVGHDAGTVLPPHARQLRELRGPRDHGLPRVAGVVRELLGGHGSDVCTWIDAGAEGRERPLLQRELQVGDLAGAGREQAGVDPASGREHTCPGEGNRFVPKHTVLPAGTRLVGGAPDAAAREPETVYDILNCGPRNRFVVRDGDGLPIIVHNCVQAIARDLMMNGWLNVEADGFDVILSVHDEVGAEGAEDRTLDEFIAAMTDLPAWAHGCPVSAAGYVSQRYRKD